MLSGYWQAGHYRIVYWASKLPKQNFLNPNIIIGPSSVFLYPLRLTTICILSMQKTTDAENRQWFDTVDSMRHDRDHLIGQVPVSVCQFAIIVGSQCHEKNF